MRRPDFQGFDFTNVPQPRRREVLKLMAASVALASGCAREPPRRIIPYARTPEQLVTGQPLFFATALTLCGYGQGVLVESELGRPIKVEGNPRHPASLGATDVYSQAAVLSLWDPERSQAVLNRGVISTWDEFRAAWVRRQSSLEKRQGAGLRVLTGSVGSPALTGQLQALLEKFPRARWHQYEPVNRDNAYEGARLAFGEPLETRYDFTRAAVVVSLDADFLSSMPGSVRYARDFKSGDRKRLYALESTPTLTGAKADHRFAVRASQIDLTTREMAKALDSSAPTALVKDLLDHQGASLVIAGDRQPPHVHALAHLMNQRLGNVGHAVEYTEPVLTGSLNQRQSLRELVDAMSAGEVSDLILLEVNPAYSTPADLEFARHLARVPFSVHLGLYRDETAANTLWHIPAAHELEAWGDTRAFDGTVTIQQPLIAPLHAGRSPHEVLSLLAGEFVEDAYAVVRKQVDATVFEQALHDGVLAGSAFKAKPVTAQTFALPPLNERKPIEIVFTADPCIHDGRFANNAWLQELPKPLTQLTWDNAALLSPATARHLQVQSEDIIELVHRDRTVRAPAWILPGHPDESVTVNFGYGRTEGGRVAQGAGFNAYALQTSDAPDFADGLMVRRTNSRKPLASTQRQHSMEGRDLVRSVSLAHPAQHEKPAETAGLLYPPFESPSHAWGMSINLDACIGCKACTIACQAENNIPVVGKREVQRGRAMHWIRVDRYFEGPEHNPKTRFQPVPCMHCERAPCEPVCPVEASVHDADGLNVQVYNRCVGTRFCSNNCPYKVRRFNFLQYSQDAPGLNAQRNPNVTVRMRGVMEKCTYCVQRIAAAKIEAEKEERSVRDGEVVTACQAVCPTQAIVFGDLKDPGSRVRQAKASPLDYVLFEELNTRPRTSYLPALENPNPEIEDGSR
jgi:Fe-S-cluster-containing dehydrogenase component/anaerobic selenocysteine-containing dehydrogenase